MTKVQEAIYQQSNELIKIIKELKGKKFKLKCGHHVTFGTNLGNDLIIYNGTEPKIICTECGY